MKESKTERKFTFLLELVRAVTNCKHNGMRYQLDTFVTFFGKTGDHVDHPPFKYFNNKKKTNFTFCTFVTFKTIINDKKKR